MEDLRALIKEILAEELSALQAEIVRGAAVEHVSVSTSTELNRFALCVLDRANDPEFASALRNGRLRFEPVQNLVTSDSREQRPPTCKQTHSAEQPVALVTAIPAEVSELRKGLITERDIGALANGETRLRVLKTARLTPLAKDEARRRGIRIERIVA